MKYGRILSGGKKRYYFDFFIQVRRNVRTKFLDGENSHDCDWQPGIVLVLHNVDLFTEHVSRKTDTKRVRPRHASFLVKDLEPFFRDETVTNLTRFS